MVQALTSKDKPRLRQPGEQLGNYRITAVQGQGAMAVVYRATDVILGREVALKVLPAELAAENPERFAQFLQEAKNAAKLQYPNVVTIYQIDQHQGAWYVAMELVEGKNLKEIIAQGRPLAAGYCLGIIGTVALAKAHESGILHRDIKPSNIMIGKAGLVKITDFGLATEWEVEVQRGPRRQVVGTPAYMAPELCCGYSPSPATDMYALGMTLYVILANEKPYSSPVTAEIMKMQVTAPIPNILPRRSDCHPAVQRILERLLAKSPQDRYEWMDQAIEDLDSLAALPANGKLPSELAAQARAEVENAPSVSSMSLATLSQKSQETLKVARGPVVSGIPLEEESLSSSAMTPLKALNRQTAAAAYSRSAASEAGSSTRHRIYTPPPPAGPIVKNKIVLLLLVLILIILAVVTIVAYEVSHTQKAGAESQPAASRPGAR